MLFVIILNHESIISEAEMDVLLKISTVLMNLFTVGVLPFAVHGSRHVRESW
jgi:hypothetical protein